MRSPYAHACITAALLYAVVFVASTITIAQTTMATISGPARVLDGDTIIIDGTHLRLQGLDAEELSQTHGPKAKATMIDIVGDQVISCRPDGTRSDNRIVATCFLPDGTDIARELVHRGWGLDCQRYSHGRYRKDEPVGIRQKLVQAGYC